MIEKNTTKEFKKLQRKGLGALIALGFLIGFLFTNKLGYIHLAIAFLGVTLIADILLWPLAFLWFGLAGYLHNFMSKVILFILFYVIVTPVGLIQRFIGKDLLVMRQWKKHKETFFIERNHLVVKKDLENPY